MDIIRTVGNEQPAGASDQHGATQFDLESADFYRRRGRIQSNIYQTDWWLAVAVFLIIASVGLAVFV